MDTVTKDNVVAFRDEVKKTLASSKNEILEQPKAMIFGDTPAVRYVEVLPKAFGNADLEQQVLLVLNGKRLYNINLKVLRKTDRSPMLESGHAGYAVAASMKFVSGSDATPEPNPEPAPETPTP